MLKEITWANYWTVIGVVALIYYFLVFVIYYRKDFLSKITSRANIGEGERNISTNLERNLFKQNEGENYNSYQPKVSSSTNAAENETLMPEVYESAEKIRDFIQKSAADNLIKEEFIMGLQLVLKNYKKLIGTSFHKSLNDLITFELENNSSIHLSAEEINVLWMG